MVLHSPQVLYLRKQQQQQQKKKRAASVLFSNKQEKSAHLNLATYPTEILQSSQKLMDP